MNVSLHVCCIPWSEAISDGQSEFADVCSDMAESSFALYGPNRDRVDRRDLDHDQKLLERLVWLSWVYL